jgi:hypothetical protein
MGGMHGFEEHYGSWKLHVLLFHGEFERSSGPLVLENGRKWMIAALSNEQETDACPSNCSPTNVLCTYSRELFFEIEIDSGWEYLAMPLAGRSVTTKLGIISLSRALTRLQFVPGAVHITVIRQLLCGLDRSDFGGLAVKLRLCPQKGNLIAFRGNLLHSIDQHPLENTSANCSTWLS